MDESREFDVTYPYTPISELESFLEDIKSKGGTHLAWSGATDWDGCIEYVEVEAYIESIEPLEEAAKRIAKEKTQKDMDIITEANRDLENYKRLKEKLGL